MARRRTWLVVVALAALLHGVGMARAILPAQDGLKFIRVARAFQREPWADVVRGADQHPLYPALVAAAEPLVAAFAGRGPETWRLSAQLVAALASIALLWPLHGMARRLFGDRVATLATLGCVLLPLPMAIGHDTLSDSLALCACLFSLRLGFDALGSGGWRSAVGCGAAAGIGFLARPEVLAAPISVVIAGAWQAGWGMVRSRDSTPWPKLAGVMLSCLVLVGVYTLVKGRVSEKLALRTAASIGPAARTARPAGQWLPKGLDDPRWDFSPKEESDAPATRTIVDVARDLALRWAEGLGGIFAFFAVWGVARGRFLRELLASDNPSEAKENPIAGRRLILVFLALFTLILARHETRMGYLSDRHLLMLVILSLPWAAAGVYVCSRRLGDVLGLGTVGKRFGASALLAAAVASGAWVQTKPAHPSRWGHREAGLWLQRQAHPGEAVLDTRGWALFVSGLPGYDYWHVRQALTDSHLAYVVVGDDELNAESPRGETLRAVLRHAGRPAASFPEREGERAPGVWIYALERPASWEGIKS